MSASRETTPLAAPAAPAAPVSAAGPDQASRFVAPPPGAMVAASPRGVGPRSEGQGEPPRGAPLVEGDVPDRRGLLLDAELPARHCRLGRRGGVTVGHAADRGVDPVRDAADVSPGGGGEPERSGVGRHVGAPADVLAGKTVRADAARVRRHVVDHHDHAVVRGRDRALRGEPVRAGVPHRPAGADHDRVAADPLRGVPGRVQGGRRRRGADGRGVPPGQRGRRSGRPDSRARRADRRGPLARRPAPHRRIPPTSPSPRSSRSRCWSSACPVSRRA